MEKGKCQEFYFKVPAQKVDGTLLVGAQSILNIIDSLDKGKTNQESAAHIFKNKAKSNSSICPPHPADGVRPRMPHKIFL